MSATSAYQAAGYDFSLLSGQAGSFSATGDLQREILNYNNDEFKTVFGPSLNASTSIINTGRLVGRNTSLSDISQQLIDQNNQVQNSYLQAKDTYARQGEINEWQAQNKLDTLFFLQILFVYFSVVVFVLYLRQAKLLSDAGVYSTVGFLLLVVIGVLWNRASYTNMSRDSRYWNRRYITTDPKLAETTPTCAMPSPSSSSASSSSSSSASSSSASRSSSSSSLPSSSSSSSASSSSLPSSSSSSSSS
jgi:hypothetical protein